VTRTAWDGGGLANGGWGGSAHAMEGRGTKERGDERKEKMEIF